MLEDIPIGIAIIEDEELLREKFTNDMSEADGLEVIDGFDSVESFFSHLDDHSTFSPDVLMLDIGLPGMSGLEALPMLRQRLPDMDIIMLTAFGEKEKILRALCSGAVGYISKTSSEEEIIDGIRSVFAGGSYMSPSIAREIVQHLVGSSKVNVPSILSSRQLEIIERLADGKTYSQIGEEIFVSTETVRTHIKKMYRTLEVSNKAEAIAKYLKGEIA